MKPTAHRVVLAGCYLAGLGSVAYFAAGGLSYYLTPLIERPRHPLYWALKPGGELGHTFGVVGTLMMIVMLAYSLRKRLRILRRLGPLTIWLDYHIMLGVCGPLFVILHSSFKVGGLVALSFWSMIAVAVSGVLGRFLYRQIPRSRAGDELSLAEVEKLDRELTRELVEELAVPPEAAARIETIAEQGVDPRRKVMPLLFGMTFGLFALRRRLRSLVRDASQGSPSGGPQSLARHRRRHFEQAVMRKALLRRRLILWERLREIFHHWHVLHKPFALIMYLFMILHIAVAWRTGYVRIGG